jgi:hypothetical protein
MRKLIFILLLLIKPAIVFSQTKADFTNAVAKFVRCYNSGLSDSLCRMFDDYGENYPCMFTPDALKSVMKNYGEIKSYKYVCIDTITDKNRITLFKMVSAKKTFMLGLTLDKMNKLGTFRFDTRSGYIDNLLKKY